MPEDGLMIKRLITIETKSTDPYHNLALEEVLLDFLPQDCCILYLWQNAHTVVIGKNQNAWKECRTEQLSADGGHLVRRASGGGAVYHDLGNLNFTFLVSKEDYDVARQLSVIMQAVATFGIPTEISGRNDVLAAGRKFSGNAFLQRADKCSHHGTILLNVDMQSLGKYLRPSKEKLQAKGVESVESRVVNLTELCPQITVEKLKAALWPAFERVYGLPAERLSDGQLDGEKLAETTARYASWDWIYGKTFPFDLSFGKRFSWGEIEFSLSVEGGYIRNLRVFSDALDPYLPEKLELALQGKPVSQRSLRDALKSLSAEEAVLQDLDALFLQQNL